MRIGNDTIYSYGSDTTTNRSSVNQIKTHLLRAVASTTVWPGDYLEVNIPESVLQCDSLVAVEPHLSESLVTPSILHSVGNKIRIENTSSDPVKVRKHDHICNVQEVYVPSTDPIHMSTDKYTCSENIPRRVTPYSSQVTIDPDGILPSETVEAFKDVLPITT